MKNITFEPMEFNIGDKVKFLNENLKGIVKAILKNNFLLIETSDGFDHEVKTDQVLVFRDDNSIVYNVNNDDIKSKISDTNSSKISSNILSKYVITTKFQNERILEIDLHLEELVEFPMRLDDWQRLHTQMQHVKKCMEAAMNSRYRKLVFIHGVGQGVLKSEIRTYLAKIENIVVKDADYLEYGLGATEVIIR